MPIAFLQALGPVLKVQEAILLALSPLKDRRDPGLHDGLDLIYVVFGPLQVAFQLTHHVSHTLDVLPDP